MRAKGEREGEVVSDEGELMHHTSAYVLPVILY